MKRNEFMKVNLSEFNENNIEATVQWINDQFIAAMLDQKKIKQQKKNADSGMRKIKQINYMQSNVMASMWAIAACVK